jgi:hypothetical protein
VPVAMELFLVQRGDAGDVKGHADGGLEKQQEIQKACDWLGCHFIEW